MAKSIEEARFLISTTEPHKYNMGDRVCGGIIVEILNGHIFFQKNTKNDFSVWDEIDSWWKEKHLYTIHLDVPTRFLYFEQYKKTYFPQNPELATQYDYENDIKLVLFMIMCEASIDEIEKANNND
jgi:hypothetical protein